ncbi:Stk1 family PASTA domain-containing Ser/Thr kinase [Virgibacillus alimentarius]|uniref:non-specific serine/threonine protein kinase n=1 Tax=Virgibacillus alimentarius TaxID=698769 RepID=A0ABS4S3T5_9BACI|nr:MULTISPECIES: Stk1 family PASTA domain-containing Ser/Thr kinase [Virgibacillus]MBP2256152.1 serine/threonine-protein kinase [Virgibacillus alimentarius]HLR66098.1 Stk1 family PASTA domain-containing Ser/Thr kinase [Virgibacillus sp.]
MLEGHLLNERYLIKATIGGGGMANVYLARDKILERDVAIKVLRLEYANDVEFIARFDREAQSATSLSHPNIVNIYDVGEENHILYMVMEYVDGMTLKEYIQRYGPLEVQRALDIMKQITDAIAHAHANDIVHRDIKPQNILIDTYGQVKVTDFGIAIALSATALTQTNSILGSVHYLSPEQARGGMATKKSDIYSLGIVLYELLTGRLPFSGETPVSIALKHLQNDTPSIRRFNQNVPQSVENIVLQATAKDPFHRYETVYEMDEALDTALDPSKLNEAIYKPPKEAGEETKAIPIITNDQFQENNNEETIIHQTNGKTLNIKKDQKDAKDKKASKKAKKKPKRKKRRTFLTILTVLFIIGIAAFFIIPTLLQPKDVAIPDVTEMEYEEAARKLEEHNLNPEQEFIHSDQIEEDLVVKTNPKAGRTVKEDSNVAIYVSDGKEKVVFKDYVGRDFNQVKRLLEDKGYEDIIAYEKHSDKPVGEIITQIQPSPDSEVVPDEASVIFEISNGPELVTLSNLKGMTEKEAKEYLDSKNLTMNVKEENSESIPEGEVIRQKPETDTEIKKGSTVDVYFSLGPDEKPPVSHEVTFNVPYNPSEEEGSEDKEEQTVEIFIDDMNHDISEVFQKEKIKKDTDFTITLTIKEDEDAEYKVMRDGEVVINKTVSYEEGE